jgi:hypothetical protein
MVLRPTQVQTHLDSLPCPLVVDMCPFPAVGVEALSKGSGQSRRRVGPPATREITSRALGGGFGHLRVVERTLAARGPMACAEGLARPQGGWSVEGAYFEGLIRRY